MTTYLAPQYVEVYVKWWRKWHYAVVESRSWLIFCWFVGSVLFWFSYLLCDCMSRFHPKHILYVGVRSTSCTIPSEIIIPTTQIPPPYFCTSHVPLPTPTVKLENLFGAIQTQMFYQYVVIILLLTDEWMYTSTNGLGCHFSRFHRHVMWSQRILLYKLSPPPFSPPPALFPSVKQKINRFLIVIIALNCFYHKCTSIIYCLNAGGRCVAV